MCAALHGQRAPRLISSQSPGNTEKLPDTYGGRAGGGEEDRLIFQGDKVKKKNPESGGRFFLIAISPSMQLSQAHPHVFLG